MTGPSEPVKPDPVQEDHTAKAPSGTGAQDTVARPERIGPNQLLLYPTRLDS